MISESGNCSCCADLEEGTPEFMDATLALADLLCKVGSPDEASQLLLRGTADDPMVRRQGLSEELAPWSTTTDACSWCCRVPLCRISISAGHCALRSGLPPHLLHGRPLSTDGVCATCAGVGPGEVAAGGDAAGAAPAAARPGCASCPIVVNVPRQLCFH